MEPLLMLLVITIVITFLLQLYRRKKDNYIRILIWFAMAFLVTSLAAYMGPFLFQLMNFSVTDTTQISASDSISYFLTSFVSVTLGALSIEITQNDKN